MIAGWDVRVFRAKGPPNTIGYAQDRVDPGEVTLAFGFEPVENIVVDPERDLGFERSVILSHDPLPPLLRW